MRVLRAHLGVRKDLQAKQAAVHVLLGPMHSPPEIRVVPQFLPEAIRAMQDQLASTLAQQAHSVLLGQLHRQHALLANSALWGPAQPLPLLLVHGVLPILHPLRCAQLENSVLQELHRAPNARSELTRTKPEEQFAQPVPLVPLRPPKKRTNVHRAQRGPTRSAPLCAAHVPPATSPREAATAHALNVRLAQSRIRRDQADALLAGQAFTLE